jgi:hypothetical protein
MGLSSTGGDREPHGNKISILGPKDDGSYVIEFRTAAGQEAGDQSAEDQN